MPDETKGSWDGVFEPNKTIYPKDLMMPPWRRQDPPAKVNALKELTVRNMRAQEVASKAQVCGMKMQPALVTPQQTALDRALFEVKEWQQKYIDLYHEFARVKPPVYVVKDGSAPRLVTDESAAVIGELRKENTALKTRMTDLQDLNFRLQDRADERDARIESLEADVVRLTSERDALKVSPPAVSSAISPPAEPHTGLHRAISSRKW